MIVTQEGIAMITNIDTLIYNYNKTQNLDIAQRTYE